METTSVFSAFNQSMFKLIGHIFWTIQFSRMKRWAQESSCQENNVCSILIFSLHTPSYVNQSNWGVPSGPPQVQVLVFQVWQYRRRSRFGEQEEEEESGGASSKRQKLQQQQWGAGARPGGWRGVNKPAFLNGVFLRVSLNCLRSWRLELTLVAFVFWSMSSSSKWCFKLRSVREHSGVTRRFKKLSQQHTFHHAFLLLMSDTKWTSCPIILCSFL